MTPGRRPLLMQKQLLSFVLIASLFMGACGQDKTLESIQESGTLTVITRNNSHCYYIYRDQEMGFEYDLARAFADFLGVQLKVHVSYSWDELLPSLDRGDAEIAAASMTITPSRSRLVEFSRQYLPVQQMVIIHKDNRQIKTKEDLAGRTVHVRRGTSYEETLKALRRRGLNVIIRVHDDVPTEELLQNVADRKIEVTIADHNVALLNRRYYPDMHIAFPITKPQSIAWAVKRGETTLLEKVNAFFKTIQDDGTFEDIYNRYYAYVELFDHLDIKRFQERVETRLPRYKKAIQAAAEEYGFDWRLIAALVYQESQFNPWAKSFSGVRGLMQLTQPTAEDMGVKSRLNPQESIRGGVKYLRQLHDLYDRAAEPDRTLIALAAYNVGKGHILDARRLASKKKLDPNKWASLEKTLPLLRQGKYYRNSRFGYCRGTEPVFHVQNILTYYEILKKEAIEYAYQEQR